jgi:hypothetical protein
VAAQYDELAQRTRDPELLMVQRLREVTLAFLDGKLEEMLAAAQDMASLGRELGQPISGQTYSDVVSRLPLIHLGRKEEALALDERWNTVEPGRVGLTAARRANTLSHLERADEAQILVSQTIEFAHWAGGRWSGATSALYVATGSCIER